MKNTFIVFVLLCLSLHLSSQNIVSVEYFIDTDPGYGSATTVTITPGADIEVSFTADLSSLTDGIHNLYIRGKDENNKWSQVLHRTFLQHGLQSEAAPNITRLEYFIDTDPGEGNATEVTVPASNDVEISFTADLSSLDDGIHNLYVRGQDERGYWSQVLVRTFLQHSLQTEALPPIVAMEYFIDTDPGVGQGVDITVNSNSGDLEQDFTADLSDLAMGTHTLYVRGQDERGNWSIVYYEDFCIRPEALFSFLANEYEITFTNESEDETSVSWDFGDGATSTQANPVHTYAAQGYYPVTITATNDCDTHVYSFNVPANKIPTDIQLSNASVSENLTAPTLVGTLSTVDADDNEHTYSMVSGTGDTDNALFTLEGNTLKANTSFNFEVKSSYSIRLQTYDGYSNGYFEKSLTINIKDENDPPTGIGLDKLTVIENMSGGTDVGTLSSSDEDAVDNYTYSLVSGDGDSGNSNFTIVGNKLQTNAVFDYETAQSYSVRIRTTDKGDKTFEQDFTIQVINVIDPPVNVQASLNGEKIDISWTANTDADLAGYRIYYGTTSGSYNGTSATEGASGIDVGTATSYSLTGINCETAHIAVTAYTANADGTNDQSEGYESQFSAEAEVQPQSLSPIPNTPTGTIEMCENSANTNYNIAAVNGFSEYVWDIQPTAAGSISGTNTSLTADWDNTFSGSVAIKAKVKNHCGTGSFSNSLSVIINPLPAKTATPTGNNDLCQNAANTNYTTTGATDATAYEWKISPANAGTISGTGTSAIVDWNEAFTGTVQISAKATNDCGEGEISDNFEVIVKPLPEQPETPSGESEVCSNDANSTFTIAAVQYATSYEWTILPEEAGTISGTSTSAIVDWSETYSGNAQISVKALNDCGEGNTSTATTVNVKQAPDISANLQNYTTHCGDDFYVLNPGDDYAAYLWNDGYTGQQRTISSLVEGLGSHTYEVTVTAANGCSTMSSVVVTIENNPISVSQIIVSTTNGATNIETENGILQMSATVLAENAADKTVTWSVENRTGEASISTAGIVTATKNGTVTIKATANDGSGVIGTIQINIIGQSLGDVSVSQIIVSTTTSNNTGTVSIREVHYSMGCKATECTVLVLMWFNI